MMLGNGFGTDFGALQCIPMGPCRLTRCLPLRLTLGVVMPLEFSSIADAALVGRFHSVITDCANETNVISRAIVHLQNTLDQD